MDDRRTEAAHQTAPARRAELLASITDLFGSAGAAVSPPTAALFSEIILGVFDELRPDERTFLVERIADLPNAPAEMLRFLASREIEVAEPVLRRSFAFEEADLAALAATLPQDRLCAIAMRAQVPEVVSDALLDRCDRAILRTLAQNPGARFSQRGLAILVQEATQKLAQRHAAARENQEERGQMLDIRCAPPVPRSRRSFDPSSQRGVVIAFPARPHRRSDPGHSEDGGAAPSAVADVIATVASGDRMMEVAGLLAESARLPVELVRRMIAKPDTMPLAVLCKAAGVSDETFAAIAAIRGRRHGHSAEAIETLVRAYQTLGQDDAAHTLRFLRARQASDETTAMPVQQNPAL